MGINRDVLKDLTKVIPFQWRVAQSKGPNKSTCVAYIDSRDAQRMLDDTVGPDNWQDDYLVTDGQLYCRVGICVDRGNGVSEWVWKSDVGTESNTEKEKGNASDSFKRACVKWGVGRFLYDQELQEVSMKDYKGKMHPADDNGNILWGGSDLTNYINNRKTKGASKSVKSEGIKPPPEKDIVAPSTKYSNTVGTYTSEYSWSPEMINKVKALSKNGVKGREVLNLFLTEYNTSKGLKYTKIAELKTDKELQGLIDYIENIPPSTLA